MDTYVEIARKIISPEGIGVRLYDALEGEAFDFLPASTFNVPNGWKILTHILSKYDEKPILKVGSVMDEFFRVDNIKAGETYTNLADRIDKACTRCAECELKVPQPFVVRQFFSSGNFSADKQAMLLTAAGGEYDWSKLETAVETLYPPPVTDSHKLAGNWPHGKGNRWKSAHIAGWTPWGYPEASWEAPEDPLENYMVDGESEELPEGLAKELHTAYAGYRDNRDRLAAAVKARGFIKGKGKQKGKDSGKGKTKDGKGGKSSGKARKGMSLTELKKITVCRSCGVRGHWEGDAECKSSKIAHAASHAEPPYGSARTSRSRRSRSTVR